MDSSQPSLRKLKREAAQKRKAQARSLKLHSEEQERLQRLEIGALVEQQRIQRLEESKETTQTLPGKSASVSSEDGLKQNGSSSSSSAKDKELKTAPKRPNSQEQSTKERKNQQVYQEEQQKQLKQLHLQQMRAVVETRRKLARESGTMLPSSSLPADQPSSLSSQDSTTLPMEDHRVVSTQYQAAGTQALMRVTLLAAGFVIGARGISARLIGQITGAIIQSWTESSASRSSTGVPIRLFRIQGRKPVVQAAVSLVEQAVAKYKELCECKRRGEFVQREHIINGVEFYYQPPPRKALAASSLDQSTTNFPVPSSTSVPAAVNEVPLASSLALSPHQVWLQHLQQIQKQKQQALPLQKQEPSAQQADDAEHTNLCPCPSGAKPARAMENTLVDTQMKQQGLVSPGSPWKHSSGPANNISEHSDCSTATGSSLFSVFGNGGLPLPIAQECQRDSSAPQFVKSSVSSTPFDFANFDLFGEILPCTNLGLSKDHDRQHQSASLQQRSEDFCMVCVERRSSARLMTCGHASFCLSCVQELGKCPVCLENLVGWQRLKNGS